MTLEIKPKEFANMIRTLNCMNLNDFKETWGDELGDYYWNKRVETNVADLVMNLDNYGLRKLWVFFFQNVERWR